MLYKIEKVIIHDSHHKTLFFSCEKCRLAEPGQFAMIWIPSIDEIPMSLSHIGEMQAITVKKVGEATHALYEMEEGDRIGIRGPYGKGFTEKGGKALFVAGGIGIAPLLPLIKKYKGEKHVILAARTKSMLLFENELAKIARLHIATDDGSHGFKGFATDLMKKLIDEQEFDIVYTCGPEIMMKKVFDICKKNGMDMQASLERYMKCGIGICDSCSINGYRVCKDGPVFDFATISKMPDFGKWKRNEAGKKITI